MNTARFLKYVRPFSNIMKETVKVNLEKKNFEKETLAQDFPMNFAKFLRTPFLQNNSGRLLLK